MARASDGQLDAAGRMLPLAAAASPSAAAALEAGRGDPPPADRDVAARTLTWTR